MVRDLELGETAGGPAAIGSPLRPHPATVAFGWLVGGVVTIAALTLGVVLALVFAATLAVVVVLATAVLGLAALVWRVRLPRRAAPGAVIEARKVGHSWVAYV